MTARRSHTLLVLVAAGLALRVLWALTTPGLGFDMDSYALVGRALARDPLHLYGAVNPPGTFRWPYPPGYLPWQALAHWAAAHGLPFRFVVVVPAILADGALALVVWAGLGSLGRPERERLAGAGLVALGPSFALTSGFHGQIDAVAILPAVAALLVWEREGARRAVVAGLLVGCGAAIKTPAGLTVLALLVSARSRREALTLVAVACAVPLALLAPFLAADSAGVIRALRYQGVPGLGGLSLFVQPGFARFYLESQVGMHAGTALRALQDAGGAIVLAGVIALAFAARRRRLGARDAAALLWTGFLVVDTSFAFQYAVWVLPFLLLSGRLRAAAWLQGALLIPALLYYFGPWPAWADTAVAVYVATMAFAWATSAWLLADQLRSMRTMALAPAPA
jgi:Glycosyltransferase family 87